MCRITFDQWKRISLHWHPGQTSNKKTKKNLDFETFSRRSRLDVARYRRDWLNQLISVMASLSISHRIFVVMGEKQTNRLTDRYQFNTKINLWTSALLKTNHWSRSMDWPRSIIGQNIWKKRKFSLFSSISSIFLLLAFSHSNISLDKSDEISFTI